MLLRLFKCCVAQFNPPALLRYAIYDGNAEEQFSIDENNGQIQNTGGNGSFKRRKKSQVILNVVAYADEEKSKRGQTAQAYTQVRHQENQVKLYRPFMISIKFHQFVSRLPWAICRS